MYNSIDDPGCQAQHPEALRDIHRQLSACLRRPRHLDREDAMGESGRCGDSIRHRRGIGSLRCARWLRRDDMHPDSADSAYPSRRDALPDLRLRRSSDAGSMSRVWQTHSTKPHCGRYRGDPELAWLGRLTKLPAGYGWMATRR